MNATDQHHNYHVIDGIVRTLLNVAEETRARLGEGVVKHSAPAGVALRQFFTVCVDPGRCSGKTSYIRTELRPWDMVVISRRLDPSLYVQGFNTASRQVVQVGGSDDVARLSEKFWRQSLDFPSVPLRQRIYVDEPAMLLRSGASLYELWEAMARYRIADKAPDVVCLGSWV